jgi:hypothetical protein
MKTKCSVWWIGALKSKNNADSEPQPRMCLSKILSFSNLQGATEKVMELVQSDAGLKFINASNAISYMPLLDHYANKG